MLNAKRLLYILPDVAYAAELLPGKKEHTFTIQTFRQINGTFFDDDENPIADNLTKLLTKLEEDEYHIVLPDFVFTNTILEVKESTEAKIKEHVSETVLPSLKLSTSTHQIETFTLNKLKDTARVQLSAIETSVLEPIAAAANAGKLTISGVSPLSWTLKAVISLEPSISVVQLGTKLYLAEHYIGIDQTTTWSVDEAEKIAETIKTLKGSEASIQTTYLLTNDLVEEKLKDLVSDTLPLQQLTPALEEGDEIPSFVRAVIETGSKTMDISDFPVPVFKLPKDVAAAELPAAGSSKTTDDGDDEDVELPAPTQPTEQPSSDDDQTTEEDVEENEDTSQPDEALSDEDDQAALPLPTATPGAIAAPVASITSESPDLSETIEADEPAATDEKTDPSVAESTPEDTSIDQSTAIETPDTDASETVSKPAADEDELATPIAKTSLTNTTAEPEVSSAIANEPDTTSSEPEGEEKKSIAEPVAVVNQPTLNRPIIKNKSNVGSMVKMIGIGLVSFLIPIVIGGGIGFGWIKLSSNNSQINPSASPIAQASAEPSPSPSPSPSPVAELDRTEYSVLVVNATSIPGQAGEVSDLLEEAGFESVKTGNAKGEYDEEAVYIVMSEENQTLIDQVAEDTGLELTYSDETETEDSAGTYDIVIVFADPSQRI